MTPAEIAAENLKATQIMGWEEVRRSCYKLLSRGEFCVVEGKVMTYRGGFSPCTSPADAHRLLMRMVKLGWKYRFWCGVEGYFARFEDGKTFTSARVAETFMLALTLAANLAFKAVKEKTK